MSIPRISTAMIRHNSNARSYSRGEEYYHGGAIADLKKRGNLILAAVEGSEATPYQVSIAFDQGGITSACCSCPYDYDGWCKHIVATLLACLHQPAEIAECPSLQELLNRLNHGQSQQLLQELAENRPEIIDDIEHFVSSMDGGNFVTKHPYTRQSKINLAAFRSQVKRIVHDGIQELESGEDDYPFADEFLSLIETGIEFAENGEGNHAIAILQTITTTFVEELDNLLNYGVDSCEITEPLNSAWTKAILSTDLAESDIVDLQVMLETWQDDINADFAMSLVALQQGWDDKSLQQIMKGDTQVRLWGDPRPKFADDLTSIRLEILEHQGRYREYLYLAAAEEMTLEYLTQLAALGRVEEVMSAAKIHLDTIETAFALAKTLREDGYLAEALEIAQSGMNLPGNCLYDFASWTSDLAESLGDRSTALNTRIIAFQADPALEDYNYLQELAGENWLTVKLNLLQGLRDSPDRQSQAEKVAIFLHEGLIDDAIATVNLNTYDLRTVDRVINAAIPHRPDWVIKQAKLRAELIMNQKKSDSYNSAVQWLQKVKAGYLQLGKESEWSAYLAQLEAVHKLKRKLMELFKQLK